jgi:hypothetical protein
VIYSAVSNSCFNQRQYARKKGALTPPTHTITIRDKGWDVKPSNHNITSFVL